MPDTDVHQPPSRSNRASLFFLALVFFFTGTIFLFIGGSPAVEDWRYRRQAVQAQAVATGKALRQATANTDTLYEISYRFALADGKPYEQTERTSVHLWEQVERGSALVAEYLPGQHESARVVQDRPDRRRRILFGLSVGAILILIGLFLFKSGLRPSSVAQGSTPTRTVTAVARAPEPLSFWSVALRSVGIWFGGIFLVVAVPMVVVPAFLFYNDWLFARSASATQGMVLTKEIRRSGRQNRATEYRLTYRFTVDGKTLEGRDELLQQGWERLTERAPTEVRYLPQRPSSSRLAGPRPWIQKAVFALVGSVFSVVGATFFIGAVRRARLEWRLRRHGVNAHGTVTELRERDLKINGERLWRLHFEFRDFQGRVHRNTIDMSADEAQQWKVGDSGNVLYDSSQPVEAVWLGRDA
jgi:hypothetical protein